MNRSFYEFFAGGGMARIGLGPEWQCILANDIDPKKMETYRANFGEENTFCCDIAEFKAKTLLGSPVMAWASFPCQDLSLAGNRIGLAGDRSGTFWGFWSAINKLKLTGRPPQLLVLENVCGLLTSNYGQDFRDMCRALASLGYSFGALVVDAIRFLPQSRPRLFIVCVRDKRRIPKEVCAKTPTETWHNQTLASVVETLSPDLKTNWIWWNLPDTKTPTLSLKDIIESDNIEVQWNSKNQTDALLTMMSAVNRQKVTNAQKSGELIVGTIYKRTRLEGGKRFQRAEVRFDGIAGCLRTPGGGSSRQTLIFVEGKRIRSRLLSIREAARLMGVPDSYKIPKNYNDGYHIFGDGLAVPAVAHIGRYLLNPLVDVLLEGHPSSKKLAA
jgi:DNA (cytosine-5)-methyltransferase 1